MSIFDNAATDSAPAGDNGGVAASDPAVSDGLGDLGTPAVVSDDGAGATGDASTPALPSYLDVDTYGDHLVKVKIDGEEKELPFREAVNGVMMQGAFTKRTQELAEERRRLQQADALVSALDQSPEATLRQLMEVYDFDPSGLERIQRDPEEQRLVEMQRQLATQQQAIQQQRIQNELTTLQTQYGATDEDIRAAARYAGQTNTDLITAYKATAFDSGRAPKAQAPAAPVEQRRQAAAAAAATVHDGASTQKGVAATTQRPAQTIREAWLAAKKTHNLS